MSRRQLNTGGEEHRPDLSRQVASLNAANVWMQRDLSHMLALVLQDPAVGPRAEAAFATCRGLEQGVAHTVAALNQVII